MGTRLSYQIIFTAQIIDHRTRDTMNWSVPMTLSSDNVDELAGDSDRALELKQKIIQSIKDTPFNRILDFVLKALKRSSDHAAGRNHWGESVNYDEVESRVINRLSGVLRCKNGHTPGYPFTSKKDNDPKFCSTCGEPLEIEP